MYDKSHHFSKTPNTATATSTTAQAAFNIPFNFSKFQPNQHHHHHHNQQQHQQQQHHAQQHPHQQQQFQAAAQLIQQQKFNTTLQSLYSNYFNQLATTAASTSVSTSPQSINDLALVQQQQQTPVSVPAQQQQQQQISNQNQNIPEILKLHKFYQNVPYKCPYCFTFKENSFEFIEHLANKHFVDIKTVFDKAHLTQKKSQEQILQNVETNKNGEIIEITSLPPPTQIPQQSTSHGLKLKLPFYNDENDFMNTNKKRCNSDSNSLETMSHNSDENNNNLIEQLQQQQLQHGSGTDDNNNCSKESLLNYYTNLYRFNRQQQQQHQYQQQPQQQRHNLPYKQQKCLNYYDNQQTDVNDGSSKQFHLMHTSPSSSSSQQQQQNSALSSMHCAICNRGFEYYSNLRRHIKTKHKIFGKEVKEYVVRHSSNNHQAAFFKHKMFSNGLLKPTATNPQAQLNDNQKLLLKSSSSLNNGLMDSDHDDMDDDEDDDECSDDIMNVTATTTTENSVITSSQNNNNDNNNNNNDSESVVHEDDNAPSSPTSTTTTAVRNYYNIKVVEQIKLYTCVNCNYECDSQTLIDKHIQDVHSGLKLKDQAGTVGLPTCLSPISTSSNASSSYTSSVSPKSAFSASQKDLQQSSSSTGYLSNLSSCLNTKFKTSLLEAILTRKLPSMKQQQLQQDAAAQQQQQLDMMLIKSENVNNLEKNTFENNIKNLLKTYSKIATTPSTTTTITTNGSGLYDEHINELKSESLKQQQHMLQQQDQQLYDTNNNNIESYEDNPNMNTSVGHHMGDDYYSENSNCSSMNDTNCNQSSMSHSGDLSYNHGNDGTATTTAVNLLQGAQHQTTNNILINNNYNNSINNQIRFSTEVWRCPYCCYETSSASRYNSHLVCHGWKPYLCPHCGSRSNRLPDMRTHISTFHPEHNVNTFVILTEEEAKATLKDYMKNRALINRKLKEMRPQPKFKCKLCPYASLYQFNLTKHVKSVHLGEVYHSSHLNGNHTNEAKINDM